MAGGLDAARGTPPGAASGGLRLHVLSQGQGAWEDRRQIASFLGLAPQEVLVTQVATGGAFGGKEDLNVQAHAALLALRTGRPVLLALSRAESLRFSVKRHAFWMDYTVACDADGRLVAVKARMVGDNGAYASVGGKVLERAAGHACSAYAVPNVDVEARAVYTNNPPSGAMRGFGANQANFAMESLLDRLAEQVGIDGWEIRWRNALAEGDRFGTGQKLGPGVGLKDTLLAVRDQYRAARYAGIACGAKNTGIGNGLKEYGRAVLRPDGDGRLTLFHSWTEMGQGTHTVFRQMAAAELGLDPERITVTVDTSHELDTGITTASRATMLGGQAVLKACAALRDELATRGCALDDLAGQEFRADIVIDWTTKLGADVEEPITHFGYGWATQVVILDDEGRIEKVIAAHDVGKALDPLMLEGQVVGGVHMGLGPHALGGLRHEGRPSRDRHAQVAGHHPGGRHAARGGHPGGGAPAGGALRRERHGRGRAGAHRLGRGGCALRLRWHPPHQPADARFGSRPRRACPACATLRGLAATRRPEPGERAAPDASTASSARHGRPPGGHPGCVGAQDLAVGRLASRAGRSRRTTELGRRKGWQRG